MRRATDESAPPAADVSRVVDRLWEQMMAGGDFWTVVRTPFKAREISRVELSALIDRGLRRTHGSYRALVALFNLPAADYKPFHAFLYSQCCNLAVSSYRPGRSRGTRALTTTGAASADPGDAI